MKSLKMTPAAVEAARQFAHELAVSPESILVDLESLVELLYGLEGGEWSRWQRGFDWQKQEADLAKTCFEKRAELQGAGEVNPLDDDEKLRQVRIAVFGCAPE